MDNDNNIQYHMAAIDVATKSNINYPQISSMLVINPLTQPHYFGAREQRVKSLEKFKVATTYIKLINISRNMRAGQP